MHERIRQAQLSHLIKLTYYQAVAVIGYSGSLCSFTQVLFFKYYGVLFAHFYFYIYIYIPGFNYFFNFYISNSSSYSHFYFQLGQNIKQDHHECHE